MNGDPTLYIRIFIRTYVGKRPVFFCDLSERPHTGKFMTTQLDIGGDSPVKICYLIIVMVSIPVMLGRWPILKL